MKSAPSTSIRQSSVNNVCTLSLSLWLYSTGTRLWIMRLQTGLFTAIFPFLRLTVSKPSGSRSSGTIYPPGMSWRQSSPLFFSFSCTVQLGG